MDKKHYESRHDRREELVDPDDSPRAVGEDMGLNRVEKSSKHDSRDKDRKKSSRAEDKERDRDKDHRYKDRERSKKTSDDVSTDLDKEHLKYNERGKDRIKDVKGKDKDHDRDRSREKERDKDKERKDRGKDKERDRGRETDKERGKEKNRDREREKENEKLKDQEKLRENDKDGDRKRERENAKEREVDQGKERFRERDGTGKEDRQDYPEWSKDDKKLMGREYDGHKDVLTSFDGDQKNAERSSTGGQTSTSELRERIMKMKEERTSKSEAGSEILSWVNKTRKLEEKRNIAREKAKWLSKNFEEQDNLGQGGSDDEEAAQNHTHDLAGVKVLDGLDKVIEGGSVVLTLKDQSILADGDINNEVDMLENVEIGEQKRRDDAYKAAKKPAGIYSEDRFNDDPMAEKKMLPQYDEPVDEGVTLDNKGHFSGEAEKKLEELRKRLQGGSTNNHTEDLNSSGKILSDYYSQEEMIQFKKPKKKKSLRKKDKLDIKALEEEAIAEGLGAGDLGSRNDGRRKAREEQERHEAEMRTAAYQLALAKADEASKALRLGHTNPATKEDVDDVMVDEEDDDLHKAIEKARKLALKKQKDAPVGPEAIARLATTLTTNQMTDDQNAATDEGQEGKVVFTEIEEFVWGLQFDEDANKSGTEDVFEEEDDATAAIHEEREDTADGLTEVNETVKGEDTTMEDAKEVTAADEIIHEVPVGKGLSGALKLLHERGTLKESINWGGRNMDKKKSKLVGIVDTDDRKKKENNKDKDMDRFKDIRIERMDEFGRIMTPKEAFRIISHRFHGKGPGKMKQEKRMKQYQEELKLKQMKNSDTPSLSVERMRETQAQLKTPYLVLSGHVKPGQTSDPRSGFATVEKDLPGGLTPMLGDKKVEHFLGIKRKPDAGSDSSTPKKPKP